MFFVSEIWSSKNKIFKIINRYDLNMQCVIITVREVDLCSVMNQLLVLGWFYTCFMIAWFSGNVSLKLGRGKPWQDVNMCFATDSGTTSTIFLWIFMHHVMILSITGLWKLELDDRTQYLIIAWVSMYVWNYTYYAFFKKEKEPSAYMEAPCWLQTLSNMDHTLISGSKPSLTIPTKT